MIGTFLFHIKNKIDYSIVRVFTVLYFIALLNAYLFDWLNDTYFHLDSNESGLAGLPVAAIFIVVVIVGPPLETLLGQIIPNIFLTKCKVENKYLLVILPSILFGLLHYYHWLYVIVGFIAGIILNYF